MYTYVVQLNIFILERVNFMKKRKLSKVLCASVCAVSLSMGSLPVMADAVGNQGTGTLSSVVTLGSDLSDEQKRLVMQYFGTSSAETNIIYITHDDEVSYLSEYVPMEQIGSRTLSCAYVRPTTEGGIKVKTANLSYVSPNMIASSLSTTGIKNCEVVAACPVKVSGTGALTGVLMAYEQAIGKGLDEDRKNLATQEMVVTSELAQDVGQDGASAIINESKKEIIQGGVQNADEINNIVNNIITQQGLTVSQEQLDKIIALLEEIAKQGIDYEEVKDALESIENNLNSNNENNTTDDTTNTDEDNQDQADGDSILDNTDDSVLGEDDSDSSGDDSDVVEDDSEKLSIASGFLDNWRKVVSGEAIVDDLGLEQFGTEYNLLSSSSVILDTDRATTVVNLVKEGYSSIVNGTSDIVLEDTDKIHNSENLNKVIKKLNQDFTISEGSVLNGVLSEEEASAICGTFKSYFEYLYSDSPEITSESDSDFAELEGDIVE